MKLGRLPRRFGAAALGGCVLVPLVGGPAAAAPDGPPAYAVAVEAFPLKWAGPVLPTDLLVPVTSGATDQVPATVGVTALARPDHSVVALSGDTVDGLHCEGIPKERCSAPFLPRLTTRHSSADPVKAEEAAAFAGHLGKAPGSLRSSVSCAGECGRQLVRTSGGATAPAGVIGDFFSVGSSRASHDVRLDGERIMATATSTLTDVVIGGNGQVSFDELFTEAKATGSGAASSKSGWSTIKVDGFKILDNPVELTGAGLRLKSARSDNEAYAGGKALLSELEAQGIKLGLSDRQVKIDDGFVTVRAQGLGVSFEDGVASVPRLLQLGSSMAVVAALDRDGDVGVSIEDDRVVVEPPTTAPVAGPATAGGGQGPGSSGPGPGPAVEVPGTTGPSGPDVVGATPPGQVSSPGTGSDVGPGQSVKPPSGGSATPGVNGPGPVDRPSAPGGTDKPLPDGSADPEVALGLKDIKDTLALRDARSVSRAFGAFLGLGLILPVARFVIRRFG